jgi:uncharacterized protein YPO0396
MPDLEGQPAWVVIVVVALFTMGTVGSAWLGRRKHKRDEDESDAAVTTHRDGVPSLPSGAAGVLEASVAAIIRDADAGRQEVAETRAEMRRLQHQHNEAVRDRDDALRRAQRALADLGTCQQHVLELRRQLNGDTET